MKLILLLCLYILTFEQTVTVTNKGEAEYGVAKTITSNGNCVFVDLRNFRGSKIRANVTVKNGRFNENKMYWGGYYIYPEIEGEYILRVYEYYSNIEYGKKIGDNYDAYTYIFKISKNSYFNYAFLAIPNFNGDKVLIECTSTGLSLLGIMLVILGVIIFIVILITVIYYIRKKRSRYNPPSEPIMSPTQPTDITHVQQAYVTPDQPAYTPNAQQLNAPPPLQVYEPPFQKPYETPVQPGNISPAQPIDVPPAQPIYIPDYPEG